MAGELFHEAGDRSLINSMPTIMPSPKLAAHEWEKSSHNTARHEAIARLAYAHWEVQLRNSASGSAEENCYRAEQELGA